MKTLRTFRGALLALVLALGGCASAPPKPGPLQGWKVERRGLLGVSLKLRGGRVVLTRVRPESPAEGAGLKAGEAIQGGDGAPFRKASEAYRFIWGHPDQEVAFEVEGEGGKREVRVRLGRQPHRAGVEAHTALQLLAADGAKVSVAVLVQRVTNANLGDPRRLQEFAGTVRAEVLANEENALLKFAEEDPDFILVDRARIDAVSREMSLQMSDEVSDEARAQIGKRAGATHLLEVELHRGSAQGPGGKKRVVDRIVRRLVEVETGRVVASGTSVHTLP